MFIPNYHSHTDYSLDSNCPIKDRIKWAIENDINELCFTDHVDSFYGDVYSFIDYNKYRKEIEKELSPYKNDLKIKYGVEIGLFPHMKEEANNYINANDLDFVIGSTHSVHNKDLCMYKEFFSTQNKKDAYHKYFEQVLLNIKTIDNFDVHGHLDFVYRYSGYENPDLNYIDHKEIIDTILKTLIEKGKGIEINVSGPRYNCKEFYPQFDIVQAYKDLGGEIITIGSDTHAKEYVKTLLLQAHDQVKTAGFKYLTTFEKRKPIFNKI